ncbi:MAG TPA: NAD(P)/FAD-dependent oxidoreductase [Cytophagaceae bacterium]
MYDVAIIGGGLAGLTAALRLANEGFKVVVVEKKSYPIQRVCGEYISNEVKPYLQSLDAYPQQLGPAEINTLLVSAPNGNTLKAPLPLGGFGISRYLLDDYLYKKASQKGVEFLLNTTANKIVPTRSGFTLSSSNGQDINSKIVIGGFGKRSNLDREMGRSFFTNKSPYIGVKYHVMTDSPADAVALHNFEDGYCGISKIEDNKFCLCYMTTRDNLKKHGSIPKLEKEVLSKNPYLKKAFSESKFLFETPEVINEISFEKKSVYQDGVFMAGDAAGMITPLCGNGMAMAIHSSKILCDELIENYDTNEGAFDLLKIERGYSVKWEGLFNHRLYAGRKIQQLFGKSWLTNISVAMLKKSPWVLEKLIQQTHGKEF